MTRWERHPPVLTFSKPSKYHGYDCFFKSLYHQWLVNVMKVSKDHGALFGSIWPNQYTIVGQKMPSQMGVRLYDGHGALKCYRCRMMSRVVHSGCFMVHVGSWFMLLVHAIHGYGLIQGQDW